MTDKYQVVPPLSDEEYQLLKRDIKENGVMIAVEYDEDGNVLDGHHRVRACQELGIADWPRNVRKDLTEDGKRAFARRINLARRQLNQAQKQELIRQQLKETPRESDRKIANTLGVSDKTVGAQRKGMERTAEIPQLEKTTGTDGKTRPRHTQRNSQRRKTLPPPPPKKGPSEKTIGKAVDAISATAVPVLVEALKTGTVLPAAAKRVAQLSEIEQHFFVDCARRGPDCLNTQKRAEEFRAMGRVAYDRQGHRHVPEGHPLQAADFDMERDFRLIMEAEAILSRVTTPTDILRFATNSPELLPTEIREQIEKLNTLDRYWRLHVNV